MLELPPVTMSYRKRIELKPEDIIRLLVISTDLEFDEVIKSKRIELIANDYTLYEALNSISKDELKYYNRLPILLLKVLIYPVEGIKEHQSIDRCIELRKIVGLEDKKNKKNKGIKNIK